MTKEEVIEVIKRNIVDNLDDVEEGDIDPQKSMKDYGANSLRELNIKIPRAELADLVNIEQLADKFMEYAGKQE